MGHMNLLFPWDLVPIRPQCELTTKYKVFKQYCIVIFSMCVYIPTYMYYYLCLDQTAY